LERTVQLISFRFLFRLLFSLTSFFFYVLPKKKGAEETRKGGRGEKEKRGGREKRYFCVAKLIFWRNK
jgi:hypothetical protein